MQHKYILKLSMHCNSCMYSASTFYMKQMKACVLCYNVHSCFQWDRKKQYESVAEVILRAIQENAMNIINKEHSVKKMFSYENYILGVSQQTIYSG